MKITLALIAYNQERYIREAISGALGQACDPIEIILSDDCSTDQTFEIMKEMAEAYEGSHIVSVRQSPENLGLIGHVNNVAAAATGDVVFMAAGDDISHADRVARCVPMFRDGVFAVFSEYNVIDEQGQRTSTALPRKKSYGLLEAVYKGGGVGLGATYAYRRECFTPPLDPRLRCEDRFLPFRALKMGAIAYIPDPLVDYRLSSDGLGAQLGRAGRLALHDPVHLSLLWREAAGHRIAAGSMIALRRLVNLLSAVPGGRMIDRAIGKAIQVLS